MNERTMSGVYRVVVVLLLGAIACFQFMQWQEIRNLPRPTDGSSRVVELSSRSPIDVRVVNDDEKPIPVATPTTRFNNIPLEHPLAVEIKNSGLHPVPVQTQP